MLSRQSPVPAPEFFSVTQKCGRRGSVSSTPTFFLLLQFLLLLGHPDSHGLGKLLHRCIQHLLMDTVGAAIACPTPVVALADILHTPLAVPVPDHGDEYIATLLAPEQSGIPGLGAISVGWPGTLLQLLLN